MNDSPKRPVGILGGSFDPIHNGHLSLARAAMIELDLAETLFIPAWVSPHKTHTDVSPAEDRLAMLRLALQGQANCSICEIELQREGVSYSFDTLAELSSQFPQNAWRLILGADAFMEFHTWKDSERFMERCDLAIAPRPGFDWGEADRLLQQPYMKICGPLEPERDAQNAGRFINTRTGRRIAFLNGPVVDLSSSEIRKRIGSRQSVKNMLPEAVEQYIIHECLYTE
ncbi:MAG: nicotinate (nicotinamide) nucleotide adenylyltransferase [Candidatus Nitrohelix vancouverensis]|uniref:Probable nicotinate-nucleotide adenylyltransferase n=1 Tax=Candidatus Nitrohelix vancouverensis TaxID=2705534 RepID=A0A7T0C0X4_9BACT|nr:MAG: nicotinate (nicotinamide) nucleotide adenylyltransferase [Candidatus Nitrohelix vancouverensis]